MKNLVYVAADDDDNNANTDDIESNGALEEANASSAKSQPLIMNTPNKPGNNSNTEGHQKISQNYGKPLPLVETDDVCLSDRARKDMQDHTKSIYYQEKYENRLVQCRQRCLLFSEVLADPLSGLPMLLWLGNKNKACKKCGEAPLVSCCPVSQEAQV